MSPDLAAFIVTLAGGYFGLGLVAALLFVTVLIKRSSAGARTAAPLQFRIIIFPACVVLWPVILIRGFIGGAKGEAHETPS